MYGTPKAAESWKEEYTCTLRELGFELGRACLCLLFHRARGLVTSVRGDDFTTAVPEHQCDCFEEAVSEVYELTRGEGRLSQASTTAKKPPC